MIAHVHATVLDLEGVTPLVVLGHGHEIVQALLPHHTQVVLQEQQLGTGHAVATAIAAAPAECLEVLVLYGDMPLVLPETLSALQAAHRQRAAVLTVLSASVERPVGYGRIVRDPQGRPQAIVEEKELQAEQRSIREINTGIYVIDAEWLCESLKALPTHGDGEYYLTDLVAMAAAIDRLHVEQGASPEEALGINDRAGLAQAEEVLRRRTNQRLMREGVTLIDPEHTYIASDVRIGRDTIIEPNVWIGSGVTIGEGCRIEGNSRIVASSIGKVCTVRASVIEYAELGDGADIGPFSHLRAGASIGRGAHIGNFAEVKNSTIGERTRIGHVSYIGDSTVGDRVNVGAGAVTVNYDGRHKYRTVIGDGAFIGSGTMLRAPVTLGEDSVTGTGSVVTRDVPPSTTVVGNPARPFVSTKDKNAEHATDE